MVEITREEFAEWKQSRATQAFLKSIHGRVEDLKELLSGDCDDKVTTTIRGQIMAFRSVLDTEFDDA
jgi:hypothetical protein